MRRWTLQRRLLATLLALGVLVAVVVAAAAWALAGVRNTQQQVIDHYFDAITTSNEQFLALVDTETAVRGYALTGDPATLEPLQGARAVLGSGGGDRLRSLLAGDEEALAALERAGEAASAWYSGWAEPTLAAVEVGGSAAVAPGEIERGKELFDVLRAEYRVYLDILEERRAAAVQDLHRQTTWLFAAVIAVAVIGLVAVAVLWLLLSRWVARPLAELAAETRTVRAGALDHAVAVQGSPELVRLARDVDEMRQWLVEQIAAQQAATRELQVAKEALESQAEDLERSNRELEQFAYVASHDLQEPLRKVASFTQMLQRRYGGQLDERADQYIEFAVDGAKRMQQLINDLLQFSRVGRITAPQTDVELDACLDRALRDLESRIEESGAVVTRDPLPVVRGEAQLLTQVFVNLVGNALKFRGEETPRVHVGARRDGDFWDLWVSDNGIGIEPQYAERVFVLFQRLHPKDVYAGTGIGLALARKIVEYHGGEIAIDADGTAHGQGTTVRFRLPAVDPDDLTGAGGEPQPVGAGLVRQDAPGTASTHPGGTA
ncbi:MAG: sensor histidine kinase [Actinomycetota bacterium]